MKIIFALLLILPHQSFAQKVLFVTGDGQQVLTDLGPGGALGPDCVTVWDENQHGPLPPADDYEVVVREDYEEQIVDEDGKPVFECHEELVSDPAPASDSVRVSKKTKICSDTPTVLKKHRLVVSKDKVAEKATKASAKKAAKDADAAEKASLKTLKAKLDAGTNPTAAEQRKLLQFLMKKVGGLDE